MPILEPDATRPHAAIKPFDTLASAHRRCLRSASYPRLLAAVTAIGASLRRGSDVRSTALWLGGELHELHAPHRLDDFFRQTPPVTLDHGAAAIEALLTAYALTIDEARWSSYARAFHPSWTYAQWRSTLEAFESRYALHDARRLIEFLDENWTTLAVVLEADLTAVLSAPAEIGAGTPSARTRRDLREALREGIAAS